MNDRNSAIQLGMRLVAISEFLNGKISATDLLSEVGGEIAVHKTKSSIQGSSAPIFVEGDVDQKVSKHHVERLVDAVMEETMLTSELEYIADIIFMHDGFSFEDEFVENLVFEISDEIANGPLTPRKLLEIKRRLL
ncbi:MAG: hypothetical protein AAF437_04055 [Pseudomonadota bacterium]